MPDAPSAPRRAPALPPLARSLSWLSLGYLTRSAANLALVAVLALDLGPSEYGDVSVFLALGAGIAYLSGSWAFMAVPVLSVGGRSVPEAFRPSLVLALAAAGVCAAAVLPLGWIFFAHDFALLALLGLYGVCLLAFQGLYAVCQARSRMRTIAGLGIVERTVTLLLVVALSLGFELTTHLAALAIAGSTVIVAVVGTQVVRRFTPLLDMAEGVRALPLRSVMSTIGPMAIVTTGSYAVAWIDILLLEALRDGAEVGIYALSYNIFTLVLQLGSLWIVVALPEHAREASPDVAPADLLSQPQLAPATIAWAAGVGLVAATSVVLMPVAFGDEYTDSIGPTLLLLSGTAFLAPFFASVAAMIATQRARVLAWVAVLGVTINVTLDLALIPPLGVWGPAVATTAQVLATTTVLLLVVLGRTATLRLLAGAATVAIPTGLVAFSTSSWAVIGLAVLSTSLGAPALRRLRRTAKRPEIRRLEGDDHYTNA